MMLTISLKMVNRLVFAFSRAICGLLLVDNVNSISNFVINLHGEPNNSSKAHDMF